MVGAALLTAAWLLRRFVTSTRIVGDDWASASEKYEATRKREVRNMSEKQPETLAGGVWTFDKKPCKKGRQKGTHKVNILGPNNKIVWVHEGDVNAGDIDELIQHFIHAMRAGRYQIKGELQQMRADQEHHVAE